MSTLARCWKNRSLTCLFIIPFAKEIVNFSVDRLNIFAIFFLRPNKEFEDAFWKSADDILRIFPAINWRSSQFYPTIHWRISWFTSSFSGRQILQFFSITDWRISRFLHATDEEFSNIFLWWIDEFREFFSRPTVEFCDFYQRLTDEFRFFSAIDRIISISFHETNKRILW